MNNKQLGTEFEKEVCELLSHLGYWAHFIVPDARGAQPFDVIAVKGGMPFAIDCKTCVANTFNISRLEENQKMAFDLWIKCGNPDPLVAVKHKNKIYWLSYKELKKKQSISLKELDEKDRFV